MWTLNSRCGLRWQLSTGINSVSGAAEKSNSHEHGMATSTILFGAREMSGVSPVQTDTETLAETVGSAECTGMFESGQHGATSLEDVNRPESLCSGPQVMLGNYFI
ncbi:hypothetical protein C8J57DRAFT_1236821 [Mycena rebaudengoi]|nr:hypothetical protein C8J57DRAFT_1236821 [Mycena rebaudengoi]